MKIFFVLLFLMVSITNVICQNNDKVASDDNIVVSAIDVLFIYPLISDRSIEEHKKKTGIDCHFIYPLLVLNNVIIREVEKVDCFRNRFEFVKIKSTKRITKAEAEKKGIPNVPKDGVLFVTTKKGYYFDFSCK